VKNDELFKWWSLYDAAGKMASPISLLLLGCFRNIGRGWTFDDLDESTCIHEETHHQFFHVFIHWESTRLYDDMVTCPRVLCQDAERHMSEFARAGLHGSVGSTDATHLGMEKCYYRLKNHHAGGKLTMPSRTYNLTVNHRRQVLSSTRGHPRRWNDKTLLLFDEFVMAIHKVEILQDVKFELLELIKKSGEIVSVKYKGVWLIVDNGYLRWPIRSVPTNRQRCTRRYVFRWLESMRKDVECTFGILKGRFRILKTGIQIHGIEATDKIWLTCCALHNMLLDIDGLDCQWDNGIPTDWEE
jgi:DDE superfamily endonuclease